MAKGLAIGLKSNFFVSNELTTYPTTALSPDQDDPAEALIDKAKKLKAGQF